MTETERKLVEHLRKEAFEVKMCFATFCNQALMFSGTVLAITISTMNAVELAVFAPLPIILVLMNVSRVGIHKYSTAVRNSAYELHLARTSHPQYCATVGTRSRWKHEMREMEWEEALRAWRIVQPTLFRKIYVSPRSTTLGGFLAKYSILTAVNWFIPSHYKHTEATEQLLTAYKNKEPIKTDADGRAATEQGPYPWFMPGELVERVSRSTDSSPIYYTGSYLQIMLLTLFYLQLLMLAPLLFKIASGAASAYSVYPLIVVGALVILRNKRINRRRVMLEDEFLSIHSCAIVWQVVAYAHHTALLRLSGQYAHYTENLALIAGEISENVSTVHDWLREPDSR